MKEQDMNQRKIDAVADALAEAHRNGGTVAELDEALLPKNWQEAFQVQDALDERLGFEVAGWKIGCTSRAQMQEFEMDHPPFFGREYRNFTQHSPSRFRMADFRHPPLIEGEFALRLGHDLPPREQAYSEAEVRDAVTDVVMAIDVVDTRWSTHPFELNMFLGNADNANAGVYVIGDVLSGWQTLDLATLPVEVYVDGKLVADTLTRSREYRCSFDELISALQWGANDLSQRGMGFRAGQVVATGSPHVPVEATAGSEIVIRYGDAGEINAKFE
tara:strand:+ start:120 stop:941 length:822 start_codon:yes stop_codon:yes gene_type:complete